MLDTLIWIGCLIGIYWIGYYIGYEDRQLEEQEEYENQVKCNLGDSFKKILNKCSPNKKEDRWN